MSEARANANQGGGVNNGGAAAPVHVGAAPTSSSSAVEADSSSDFPQIIPGQSMRVPESEAEVEAMMRAQFNDDPELMRRAGREFLERMNRLAEQAAAKNKEEKFSAPAPAASVAQPQAPVAVSAPAAAEPASTAPVAAAPQPTTAPQPATSPTTAASLPHVATQPTAATAPPQVAVQPQQPQPTEETWPLSGYAPVPEGLYTWTPESWGGRLLRFVPDRAIERERQSTILIVILMASAYVRNRAGRVVSLPAGGRVAIHAGVAWGPVIPLAKGPEGRPVCVARPSLDPSGKPVVYDLGDGAREWGIEIVFEFDPKDPRYPRLIDMETVKGARPEADGGGE